jgi:hypothetical protein
MKRSRGLIDRDEISRQEFDKSLRPHLSKYAKDKVDRLVESLWVIVRLSGIAPRPMKDAERLEVLNSAAETARAFEQIFFSQELSRAISKPDPHGLSVGVLAKVIEEAGGPDEFFRRINEGWRPKATTSKIELVEDVISNEPSPDSYVPDGTRLYDAWRALATPLSWYLRELDEKVSRVRQVERRGREKANSDEVLTEVARAFRRVLGEMPSKGRTGVFYALAVEITGRDDPRRQVEAAVAAVQNKARG